VPDPLAAEREQREAPGAEQPPIVAEEIADDEARGRGCDSTHSAPSGSTSTLRAASTVSL
jgi:hypothetical protein